MTTTDVDLPAHDDHLPRPDTDPPPHLGSSDRWILASFSAAAGLVHVVMAPSHMGTSAVEGWGFLVVAWLQVAMAVAIVVRPRRWMLGLVLGVNVALIGLWAVSRTAGLPIGAHASHPESVSFVDGSCVAFEIVLVGLSAIWLWRPGLVQFRGGLFSLGVPLAVFVVASAAIASPQARDHSAHSHGETADDGPGDHHVDPADPDGDKGLAALTNGHQHETGTVKLDRATQTALAAQLVKTAELVERYPTVAAAEAQGVRRSGPFAPGQGSHFTMPDYQVNGDGVMDPEDLLKPILIFDGAEPDSPLAGFMFYMAGDEEPEGFAGGNDHWHHHTNTCIVFNDDGTSETPFGADDTSVTEAMCDAEGGQLMLMTGWMVHVWTVPGYESDRGVFSEINTKLTCPDGTYHQIPWSEVGDRGTFCRSG